MKFSVISICSTREDVSMVIVAEGTFKTKDMDKNTLQVIYPLFPLKIVDLPLTTPWLKGGN